MDEKLIAIDLNHELMQGIEEQVRELRTSIFTQKQEGSSILFTSTYAGEGKSTLSLSLAISLSRCGKKVIWLDCDFRTKEKLYSIPENKLEEHKGKKRRNKRKNKKVQKIHSEKEEIPQRYGVTDYLNKACSLEKIVYTTEEEKLNIIPLWNAVQKPGDILEQGMFEELLVHLKKDYEYIIIDSSAMTEGMEGKIIASKCDSIIYVIAFNKVRRTIVKKVLKEIEKCHGTILGVVMNKTKVS